MSITTEQYIKRNLEGFEGDGFVKEEISKLIEKFNVKTIIETGTFRGGTTKVFSEMVEKVITIELTDEYFNISKEYLKGIDNVIMFQGSSEKVLGELLNGIKESALFFLDAHFYDFCPLLDELKVISENGIKPVIVIHDWKVPGRPDLGFDSYKGQDFTFEWIEQSLKNIYGNDFKYHYNDQANGAKRGLIYIYPNDNTH